MRWPDGPGDLAENCDEDFFALHSAVLPALFEAINDPRGIVSDSAISALEAYTEQMGATARAHCLVVLRCTTPSNRPAHAGPVRQSLWVRAR